MKGIILAGGAGTRLYPLTKSVSKQMLPVHDKPMIFYPLSILMLSGIRDILIITTPRDRSSFENLLGNGDNLGINISYKEQNEPRGIAEAFLLGEDFINDDPVTLILGDNLFFGYDLVQTFKNAIKNLKKATIFAYPVKNPSDYGVVEFNKKNEVISIEEKPQQPLSRYAVTGIYMYDGSIVDIAKNIKPSERGELEITEINKLFLDEGTLDVEIFGRGVAWLDTGSHQSLLEAGNFINIIEKRQGFKVACIEEIAWRNKWISSEKLLEIALALKNTGYGNYLLDLLDQKTS
tara:strand:+ start:13238 stop:14113 length:876 start_codon:yes stop_codon:yes gene_type:complete